MIQILSPAWTILWVAVMTAANLALLRVQRRFLASTYSSIADILTGLESSVRKIWGVVLRMTFPIITTAVGVFLARPVESVVWSAPAFLSALLVVWPVFWNPQLVRPDLWDRRRELYLVYILFILAWGFLGFTGGAIGAAVAQRPDVISWALPSSFLDLKNALWAVVIGEILLFVARNFIRRL